MQVVFFPLTEKPSACASTSPSNTPWVESYFSKYAKLSEGTKSLTSATSKSPRRVA